MPCFCQWPIFLYGELALISFILFIGKKSDPPIFIQIDFNHHNIDADLHGIALSYPTRNEIGFSLLNPYFSPDVLYRSSRWLFTLSVPVSYHLHHIRNKLTDESDTEHFTSVAPAFSLRHQISAKMDITAQFKYSLSPPKAEC